MRQFSPITHSRAVVLVLNGCLIALSWPAAVDAAGPPPAIEVSIDTGTADGRRRLAPNELHFERGKYYKLAIHNPSPHAHYFSSEELGARVYTVKIKVANPGGEMLPRSMATRTRSSSHPARRWLDLYPMMRGKDLRLYSEKDEDLEAGMAGTIETPVRRRSPGTDRPATTAMGRGGDKRIKRTCARGGDYSRSSFKVVPRRVGVEFGMGRRCGREPGSAPQLFPGPASPGRDPDHALDHPN